MLAKIIKCPVNSGKTWVDRWRSHRRHIIGVIERCQQGFWSEKALINRIRFGGHVQRHSEKQAWAVMNYRDLAWWRYRQLNIKSGPSDLRHPGRIAHTNWETLFEKVVDNQKNRQLGDLFLEREGYRPQFWGHLALNREIWRMVEI